MTKIDIVSGFLGAGKTTLIKKLLKEALSGQKVVLIENEFGEIGVDGGFLKEAGIEIKEMNSGCICCSLVGDFGTSLKEVLETYHPERILIEPSGVGKLSDVAAAVANVDFEEEVQLNSAVAVVDASKCKMYIKNFGEFFVNQIEHAGTIILSRTGNISEEKLNKAIGLLNKVKIKYINTTSCLEYTYEKFAVNNSMELEHIWHQYEEMKQREQKIRENIDKLSINNEKLIALLEKHEVEDPKIWLYQTVAILDQKEMVEIRHRLNVRRQKLRDRIDYNNQVKLDALFEIKKILEQKPE